jgi:hypothetical protein
VTSQQEFSMVQEACDTYEVNPLPDGRTEIKIIVPPRFAELWLVKLSELRGTTDDAPAHPTNN